MIRASAPGKMILLGEYAVLHGAPALVYTVERRAHVNVKNLREAEFQVSSPSLQIESQPFVLTTRKQVRFDPNLSAFIKNRLMFFKKVFEHILTGFAIEDDVQALGIELITDAFYSKELHGKLGFGSSAAMTVALTGAIAEALQISSEDTKLFKLALDAHRAAQGNVGSGIDIAASYFGGVLNYTVDAPPAEQRAPQKIDPWKDLPIAVVWSGASASTSRMVQSVSKLNQEKPELYKTIMKRLGQISTRGTVAYSEKQIDPFISAIDEYYHAMKELGEKSRTPIISEAHLKLAEIAHKNESIYKPSGAGGGDIGLLFATSPDKLSHVISKIVSEGFRTVDVTLAEHGITVQNQFIIESNDNILVPTLGLEGLYF